MRYKIIVDGQEFLVDVDDIHTNPILVKVNGESLQVWPEKVGVAKYEEINKGSTISTLSISADPSKIVLPTIPTTRHGTQQTLAIRAPIPGVINKISINVSDQVEIGQELCVLEAMKMNNIIRSPQKGVIVNITVNIGQHVKHGELIMELE